MGGNYNVKLIDDNGTRIDGRRVDELRPIKIEAGVLKRADGSAYVEFGKNKVLAAVYGPRECHPRHMQDPSKAIVQVKYNMIAFSVSDRKRPGPDRRSVEISKIISEAFEHVIFTENFPRTSIDVYIEVLQANAGTRCAGLTAASVALADAGIPMKDLVPAVAVGKVNDQVVLDLNKEEDNFGQADVPIAMIPRTGEVLLLQMDGHLTRSEFDRAIELASGALPKIYELQKEALVRRYAVENEGEEPGEEPQASEPTEG
ncbi:MAG TPA: exosome complex exonuclease Rrp41 [Methanomassiliicoccales archaeon]|jgi:exosome complex component RRP41|nr:exosome complex exonuclease Rrp41 [Methanomassiliicoccales archaeon]